MAVGSRRRAIGGAPLVALYGASRRPRAGRAGGGGGGDGVRGGAPAAYSPAPTPPSVAGAAGTSSTPRQVASVAAASTPSPQTTALARRDARERQLASFFAGGFAGTFSAAVTCPMEVVKTRLQQHSSVRPLSVIRSIAMSEGPRGFFTGLPATLVGILPARAVYFWAYATVKAAAARVAGEDSPLAHVAAAASAGFASNTLTNPIWMLKTRMQLQAGAAATAAGTPAGAAAAAAASASPTGAAAAAAAAAVAGGGGGGGAPVLYRGYADAIGRILREEGVGAFYQGLGASYWGATETVVQFVVYERLKRGVAERNMAAAGRGDGALTSLQLFLSAAMAKLVASAATYPHEVVRTRMRQMPTSGAPAKYTGVLRTLVTIGQEEGRAGLYAGMGTHLLRVVPSTALMFLTYETVMRLVTLRQAARPVAAAAAAAAANAAARDAAAAAAASSTRGWRRRRSGGGREVGGGAGSRWTRGGRFFA